MAVLEIKNLKFKYNNQYVLKEINLSFEKGELVGILGQNGAGKSTLLKCIAKILKPEGAVYIENINVLKLSRKEIARKIGYVPQRGEELFLTVFDAVLLGRTPYFNLKPDKRDLQLVEKVLELLELKDLALKFVCELSGGEIQRVVLARALVQEPKILLLDEPTNNLDIKYQLRLFQILQKIKNEKNLTVLIICHDLNLALRYCERFVFLKEGKIIAQGDQKIVTPSLIKEIFEVNTIIKKFNEIPVVIFY